MKRANRVEAKKQKLFTEGKVERWELSEEITAKEIEMLMTNKELAFECMLPKETKEISESLATYGYYLNKLIEETQRISQRDYSKLRKFLRDYTNDQSGIVKSVPLIEITHT